MLGLGFGWGRVEDIVGEFIGGGECWLGLGFVKLGKRGWGFFEVGLVYFF